MSAVDADADAASARGPAAPVARLAGILVLLGLAGVVTAGGIVALAARMQASITGSEVDGLSMLLPGLVVTAVMASLAAASTARVARGARRVPPLALARHASALAIRPLAVTAVLVGVVCESRLPGGLAEVASRRPGAAALPLLLFAGAAVAQVVAARARGRRTRIRALAVAGAALVAAAVAMPYLVTASLQSGALVLSAALLLRRAPGRDPVS